MSPRKPATDHPSKRRAKAHWTARFTQGVNRETLAAHPWLKPVAHRLLEPGLWHVQHEAVARGVAIGLFWAFALRPAVQRPRTGRSPLRGPRPHAAHARVGAPAGGAPRV